MSTATPEPTLAERYGLPVIDLRIERVDPDAADSIPLHVLTRIRALPYRIEDGRLKIAVVDPSNIQLTDELRMVSDYPIDLGVAAGEPTSTPSSTGSPAVRSRSPAPTCSASSCPAGEEDDDDVVDLDDADGVSDAPGDQARELGHPPGVGRERERRPLPAARRLAARAAPRRRDAPRGRADPEGARRRRRHAAQGAGEARHRRAPHAAGRPHLGAREEQPAASTTSASPCCRRSTARA